MGTGSIISSSIDIAQLVLYLFWAFFAGLIYYLVRENHREGYPMETTTGRGVVTGWPIPAPKTYKLAHGDVTVPNLNEPQRPIALEPAHRWAGAPLVPTGNPMLDGVGPGSWAPRADRPDMTFEDVPKIVPLHLAPEFSVEPGSVDPRGLPVVGADKVVGGTVVELWLDTPENLFRYLEIELTGSTRRVLLPMNFARVLRNQVKVGAILGSQFAGVPGIRQPDVVTMLEEEKIQAYYGAGTLYAEPSRTEPLI